MTATTGEVLRDKDGNYTWEGRVFTSVTTVLKTAEIVGLDDGLGYVFGQWTADEAARIIRDGLDGREFMRPAGWQSIGGAYQQVYEPVDVKSWTGLKDYLAKVGRRRLNQAADRGTLVHHAVGHLVQGFQVTGSDVMSQYSGELWPDDDAEGCIDALAAWWARHDIEPIAHEITGLNTELGYGGTIDLVCKIDGAPFVVDFKTSGSWRIPHMLQLAAYRAMDTWLEKTPDGLVASPAPDISALPTMVVLVRPESVVPYVCEPEQVDQFFVMFRKLFDIKAGWTQRGKAQRVKDLVWTAF